MSVFSEKLLLYRVELNSDTEAFAKLYDKYVSQIYRFVYFKVGTREEAEDIVSEVFLKAWNYLQNKKSVQSFRGLLYQIARNSIIDLYRSKARNPEFLLTEEMEIGDHGEWSKKMSDEIDNRELLESIKKLKQEYQEIVTLRFIEQLSLQEIGQITGKSMVTVRVTLHRAIAKLKSLLAASLPK